MTEPKVINGRYEVLGTIGTGGMGVLYKARDPWIGGRIVALKLLRDGLDDDEIRTRFEQEASAAGVLEHENIVRIFDVGEDQGQPFIAMEFVDGDTLAALIRDRTPIPLLKRLEWIEQLCDALAYAHAFGIVHRDIKPLNLIIERRRQRLKVLDFGIARVANSGITSTGMMIGTTNYMSPEQMRGDATIDHRSDIFSVGATVYELLVGKRAFPGGLGDGLMGRIMTQPAPSLLAADPSLPPELDEIVGVALAKDPADRYGDLAQMRDEIRALRHRLHELDDRTAVLPPPGSTDRAAAPPTGAGTARTGRPRTDRGRVETARGTPPPVTPTQPPPLPIAVEPAPTRTGPSVAAPSWPATTPATMGHAVPPTTPGTTPPAGATTPAVPVPPAPRQNTVVVFLAMVVVAAVGIGALGWWLVPWDTVLRPWRAPSESAAQPGPAPEDATGATPSPEAERAAARAAAARAAEARLAGITITIDSQPWSEVRLVPALSDSQASSLPPDVVRELARERGPFTTPFVTQVPAGEYVVSFDNDALGLSHTQRITVDPAGSTRWQVALPGFDAERFIAQVLREPAR